VLEVGDNDSCKSGHDRILSSRRRLAKEINLYGVPRLPSRLPWCPQITRLAKEINLYGVPRLPRLPGRQPGLLEHASANRRGSMAPQISPPNFRGGVLKDAAGIAGMTREYLIQAVIGSYGPAVKRAHDLQSRREALLINYIVPQA